jgi:hypothetical protein
MFGKPKDLFADIVPLYEIWNPIDHMGVGFPSVFLGPVSNPLDQELMVLRVSCNDDLRDPSLVVSVDRRWGRVGLPRYSSSRVIWKSEVDPPSRW